MRVWRLCRSAHLTEALSGKGGLLVSGRWHTRGRAIIYSSGSLSLAALELLVHVERSLLPPDLVQLEIETGEAAGITIMDPSAMPGNWRQYPFPAGLQRIGDDWLVSGSSAVLQVPSALIPTEYNFLLNPQHEHARFFTVVEARPFNLDTRLLS